MLSCNPDHRSREATPAPTHQHGSIKSSLRPLRLGLPLRINSPAANTLLRHRINPPETPHLQHPARNARRRNWAAPPSRACCKLPDSPRHDSSQATPEPATPPLRADVQRPPPLRRMPERNSRAFPSRPVARSPCRPASPVAALMRGDRRRPGDLHQPEGCGQQPARNSVESAIPDAPRQRPCRNPAGNGAWSWHRPIIRISRLELPAGYRIELPQMMPPGVIFFNGAMPRVPFIEHAVWLDPACPERMALARLWPGEPRAGEGRQPARRCGRLMRARLPASSRGWSAASSDWHDHQANQNSPAA